MSKDKELKVGYIEPKEPGVFATLILPEVREAMKAGATITALGVSCGSTAIGAVCAVVSHTDTLEILSLYVAPKYRRMGAATLMMDTFHSFLPEAINRISIDYVAAD
ncbi:MAG: GNAT family N-acetyltransferase, partial [Lachnospiraceae bacterium]|nr:GNAT family N-acetyltransferase [Lachnospiraceae bacterium]